MSWLNGYKTYIVAAATIVFAVVSYWNGAIDQASMIAMILGALGASTIRHGINTSGDK